MASRIDPGQRRPRGAVRPGRDRGLAAATLVVLGLLLLPPVHGTPGPVTRPLTVPLHVDRAGALLAAARASLAAGARSASVAPGPTGHPFAPSGSARPASSSSAWINRTTAKANPGHVGDAGVAYDPVSRSVVLADGLLDNGFGNAASHQTWNYSNGTWRNLSKSSSYTQPSTRWGLEAGLAYDAYDGYVLLFGGLSGGGTALSDTWTFSNGTWTQLNPSTHPGARTWPAMTYDAYDGYVVLFGGATAQAYGQLNDTWTFRSGTWTQLNDTVAPSPRRGTGLVYDATDQEAILFGGEDASFTLLNDTWSFRAGNWTELFPKIGPSPRLIGAMAYQPWYGYVLLVGGCTSSTSCLTAARDQWVFRSGTWTEIDQNFATLPNGRGSEALTYDAADRYMFLFGGSNWTFGPGGHGNDTWSFNWSLEAQFLNTASGAEVGVPFRVSAQGLGGSFAYQYEVQVSGGSCASLNASSWNCTFTTMGPGSVTVYVNDSVGDSVVLNRTFTVAARLSAHLDIVPALTEVGQRVRVWANASGGVSPIRYAYAGLPPGCTGTAAATFNCTVGAKGNYTAFANLSDADGAKATGEASITIVPGLVARVPTALQSDVGRPVAIEVNVSGGIPGYVIDWSGAPSACASNGTYGVVCRFNASGSYLVPVRVVDAAEVDVVVSTRVAIVGLPVVTILASPTIAVGATTVNLSAVATGGTGAVDFRWTFGDGGTATGATVSHAYASTGNFTVTAVANDSVGGTNATSIAIRLVDPLVVTLLEAPASGVVDAGGWANLTVVAAYGYGTYVYDWSAFPFGCLPTTGPELRCANLRSGESTIQVSVTDGLHEVRTASAHLLVDRALALAPGATFGPAACGAIPPVMLSANATGGTLPIALNWSFGDGTSATGASVEHNFSAAGTFPVTVRATDAANGSTSRTISVTVAHATCASPNVGGVSTPALAGLGVAALAIVVAVALLMRRRRGGAAASDAGAGSEPAPEYDETPIDDGGSVG